MRSDRLARALLRLYPRAWRERYGDELLALIDDAGLTWRIVADVIAGATVERVRALIELRNRPVDPIARTLAMSGRQLTTDILTFLTLVLATVSVLAAAGVAWPQWSWWFWMFNWPMGYGFGHPSALRAERVGQRYYIFLEGVVFTAGLWLLARALAAASVPEPSETIFETALFGFLLSGAARFIYCGIRSAATPGTWFGMHDVEIRAWHYGAFAIMVGTAWLEPSSQFFWPFVYFSIFLLRPATGGLTRLGAARRRAAFELNAQRLREKFPVQVVPPDWK